MNCRGYRKRFVPLPILVLRARRPLPDLSGEIEGDSVRRVFAPSKDQLFDSKVSITRFWEWICSASVFFVRVGSQISQLHVGRRPLPWENKISQMPYPRANKDNQIPTSRPASP